MASLELAVLALVDLAVPRYGALEAHFAILAVVFDQLEFVIRGVVLVPDLESLGTLVVQTFLQVDV